MSHHIEINNLTKRYGSLIAIDDISFSVEKGSFASIVGPSGSGKTTALRMIAGFEDPTNGGIEINGRDITDDPPFERDVNMVFQNLALFPHLTVAENIKYGLKYGGESYLTEEIDRKVETMLEMVNLPGYGDRDISELSGGEQQRIALARAVVKEPEILLFDEPLASLDRKLRQEMKVELQRIQSETGITFLYVTHDQEVALSVSDQMIVMKDGEIAQRGEPKEIYDQPTSAFVADFIGDANIVTGSIGEIGEDYVTVDIEGETLQIPVEDTISRELIATRSVGSEFEVGFRPHDATLSSKKLPERLSFGGTVTGKTYAGEKYQYLVDIENNTITISDTSGEYNIGDSIYVGCDHSAIHTFETTKQKREVEA
ncbi:ABC transporter ATP-binding protein [Halosolutus amylolyticus]|uniref:Molybdate/tungstate import ATP-binding protein WtpC n=1 Tax=Halosolutus amylolyticus TaxID=2932267 RepID=A0ABD5PJV9_9EURY|nr:ABC transporter ATP-binding protein [Halosolutus amylolyticus]